MSTALNLVLLFLMLGWMINAAVIQVKDGLVPTMWLNAALAMGAGWFLVVRLG